MKSWALAGIFLSVTALTTLTACDGEGGGNGGFGGFGSGGGGTGGSTSSTMTGGGGNGNGGGGGQMAGACDGMSSICNDGIPNTGDCSECAIAVDGPCRAAAEACANSMPCSDLDDCLSTCAPGDGQCVSGCENMYPTGVADHDALVTCIFCDACLLTCNEPACTM